MSFSHCTLPHEHCLRRKIKFTAVATLLVLSPLSLLASTAGEQARHALLGTAQNYRDTQEWGKALEAYRQGKQRFPQDTAFVHGEIYALADGGQPEQATVLAQRLLDATPNDVDALLVMGYAQLRHHGVFASLEYIDRAMQIGSNKAYVVRDYVMALQRAHMPSAALAVAERHPDLLSPAQMRELQADAVAESVRYADLPARSEAERFQVADAALAKYDTLFEQWAQIGSEVQPLLQRARIDRLQALHARFYMAKVVQEYEALLAQGVEVPNYALATVASAYLYERMPERSTQIYEQLIASGYMREDAVSRQNQDFGLLYSYSDQGDVAASQEAAHPLREEYSQWRFVEGDAARIPNAAYLDARHTASMMDFYANDTPQAQVSLEQMLHAAPNNNSLRTDLSSIYRSRGWPRKAEEELKIAESYDPRAMSVEIGQGLTALDLQEWRQVEALSGDMQARFPENRSSQRLQRLWRVHNMHELRVEGYKGLGNNNPVAGGRDFGLDTTLYSQPLAYNWRIFAGMGHRSATYDDAKATHNYGRVGLEWRSRDWNVTAEVSDSHYGHGSRLGSALSVDYALNDYWSIHAGAQWKSRDTNLDALRNNITSNRFDLGVQWRESERRSWGLTITPSDFSDGNRRLEMLLGVQQRLWTQATWFLDGGLELFASRNSRTDVPYYSPRREYSILPTLSWNHTIYQRYQTAWTQQLSAGLGGVNQHSYGTGSVAMISYGQRYKANDVFEIGGTLSAVSRPYDGVREREWRFVFDMTYRF